MIRTKTRQLILRYTKNLVNQEGKGDQDTTTDNEWKHLRNPTHQVFVEGSTQAQFFLASASLCSIFSVEDICFAIQDGLDQVFCLTDTGCDWFRDQFFAIETSSFNCFICCNDDPFSFGDFFSCQAVADTRCPVGFNADRNTHFFPFFDEGFFCHVSVGDTCCTCCNGNDERFVRRSCFFDCFCFFRFFSCSFLLFCIKGCDHLIRSACLAKFVRKSWFHQVLRQFSKGCQVSVICSFWSCDHEEQVCWLAIK